MMQPDRVRSAMASKKFLAAAAAAVFSVALAGCSSGG
jgi:hypothetical protein